MIDNTFKVLDKRDGKIYDCFPQMLDLNFNGKYVLRYNIGINGYIEWTNICCIYSNDEFNNKFKVID